MPPLDTGVFFPRDQKVSMSEGNGRVSYQAGARLSCGWEDINHGGGLCGMSGEGRAGSQRMSHFSWRRRCSKGKAEPFAQHHSFSDQNEGCEHPGAGWKSMYGLDLIGDLLDFVQFVLDSGILCLFHGHL